jgi:hypothetical protein
MIHAITTEPGLLAGLLVGATGPGGWGGVVTPPPRVGAGGVGGTPPDPPDGLLGHTGAVGAGTSVDGAALAGLDCGDAGNDRDGGVDVLSRGPRDPVHEAKPRATSTAEPARRATTIRFLIAMCFAFRWKQGTGCPVSDAVRPAQICGAPRSCL